MKLKKNRTKATSFFIISLLFLLAASPVFSGTDSMQDQKEKAISDTFRQVEMDETLAITSALEEAGSNISIERENFVPFILSRTHPYAAFVTQYNNNIFQVPKRTGDIINIFTPGIKFGLSQESPSLNKGKNRLELDLGIEVKNYVKHDKLSRQMPYASFVAEVGKGQHTLRFSDNWRQNSGPASAITLGTEGTVDSKTNYMNLNFESMGKHFGYDFDYNLSTIAYEGDYRTDSSLRERNFSLTGFLIPRALPKTRLLLELETTFGHYFKFGSDGRNYDDYRIWIGETGKLSSKITGLAKIGYQKRDLKNQKDRNLFATIIDLDYLFSNQTHFYLHTEHGAKAPTYSDEGVDIASAVSLAYQHNFTFNRKLSFRLECRYGIDDYSGGVNATNRKDKTYGFSPKLEYSFQKWLKAFFQYNYTKLISNQPDGTYLSNLYSLNVEGNF